MKQLSKSLAALLVASCCAVSCEQDNLNSPNTELELLTQKVLSSGAFKNLGIPVNALDVGLTGYVNDTKSSIAINLKDMHVQGAVVALLGENNTIRTVVYVEMRTETRAENVYQEMKAGSFNGVFLMRSEDGGFEADIVKSKITREKTIASPAGRIAKCRGWTEKGGPLDCFGERLVNMDWWSSGRCYATFMWCMTDEVISCVITDCAIR